MVSNYFACIEWNHTLYRSLILSYGSSLSLSKLTVAAPRKVPCVYVYIVSMESFRESFKYYAFNFGLVIETLFPLQPNSLQ